MLDGFSFWHLLIVLAVVLVLFGGSGKISSLMGDVAKGIKSFKKGLAEEDKDEDAEVHAIEHGGEHQTATPKSKSKVNS